MYQMLMVLYIQQILLIINVSNKAKFNYKEYYKCHNQKKFLLLYQAIKQIKQAQYHKINSEKHQESIQNNHGIKILQQDQSKSLCVVLQKKVDILKHLNGLATILNDNLFINIIQTYSNISNLININLHNIVKIK